MRLQLRMELRNHCKSSTHSTFVEFQIDLHPPAIQNQFALAAPRPVLCGALGIFVEDWFAVT
jgi:hypothetical protein